MDRWIAAQMCSETGRNMDRWTVFQIKRHIEGWTDGETDRCAGLFIGRRRVEIVDSANADKPEDCGGAI
jgi:hypothetical protein